MQGRGLDLFHILHRCLPRRLRKIKKNFSQYSPCHGWDSYRAHSEYKTEVLPSDSMYSVMSIVWHFRGTYCLHLQGTKRWYLSVKVRGIILEVAIPFLTSTSSGRWRCICGRLPFQVRKIGLNLWWTAMMYLNMSVKTRTLCLGEISHLLCYDIGRTAVKAESAYAFFFCSGVLCGTLFKDGDVKHKQLLIKINKPLNTFWLLSYLKSIISVQ
jgi:hypothetical protein